MRRHELGPLADAIRLFATTRYELTTIPGADRLRKISSLRVP